MRRFLFSAAAAGALACLAKVHAQTPALQVTTLNVTPAFPAEALQSCGLAVDASDTTYVGLFDSTLRKIGSDGTMTLLAGTSGQSGDVDGTGSAARLDADMGLAVDASDVVYVCELSGAIRRVTPDGVVTTIAGLAGAGGYADGTGSAARFNGATNLCVDPTSGNLYVADTFNYVIRRVTPAGVVTTVAGQPGISGYKDGAASSAIFTAPASIACDNSGNVYVADYIVAGSTRTGCVRRITPGGAVSTLATGLASNLHLAVDVSGNCYAAQSDYTVVLISPSGTVAAVAGVANQPGDADGTGVYCTLAHPVSIAMAPNGAVVVGTWDALRIGQPVGATPTAPEFVQLPNLPANALVPPGPFTLSVLAVGYPAPTYQWYVNGVAIAGATGPSLSFPDFQSSNSGVYTVVAANSAGSVTSPAITLTYETPFADPRAGSAPTITMQPATQTITAGATAVLTVGATGAASYQWTFDGTAVPGATEPSLILSPVTAAEGGTYAVATYNAAGVVTWSAPASLTVAASGSAVATSQLANISARAFVGTGSQTLVAGFSVAGSGSKALLLCGIGPSLAAYGVADPLAQPQLTLMAANGAPLASDTAWGGGAGLASLMTQVGAFALPAGSADSAMEESLAPGTYTIEVSGVGGSTGTALAEVFDGDLQSGARIVNLSARGLAGAASNALVAGFVVSGTANETVLVRGIGPTLASFGVAGTLPTTLITVSDSNGNVIATDSGWDGSSTLAGVFAQVGAFSLAPGSADSAVVLSLPPGAYTVQLAGANGESGVGLVELYEVP